MAEERDRDLALLGLALLGLAILGKRREVEAPPVPRPAPVTVTERLPIHALAATPEEELAKPKKPEEKPKKVAERVEEMRRFYEEVVRATVPERRPMVVEVEEERVYVPPSWRPPMPEELYEEIVLGVERTEEVERVAERIEEELRREEVVERIEVPEPAVEELPETAPPRRPELPELPRPPPTWRPPMWV